VRGSSGGGALPAPPGGRALALLLGLGMTASAWAACGPGADGSAVRVAATATDTATAKAAVKPAVEATAETTARSAVIAATAEHVAATPPRRGPEAFPGERGTAFGVQIFEVDVDTPALSNLRAAGVRLVRARALWKLIETEPRDPPRYDWSVTDELFARAEELGFEIVAAVYANPPWAAERECGPVLPEHLSRYERLWGALVERYDGDGRGDAPGSPIVLHWQVGNEVDFDAAAGDALGERDYGSCFGADPGAYARHVAAAVRAGRAASPSVRIGFGPVAWDRFTAASAPEGWTAPPGPYTYDFTARAMEALLRLGPEPELEVEVEIEPGPEPGAGGGTDPRRTDSPAFDDRPLPVDFVALHSYPDNGRFWDGPDGVELVSKVRRFRREQLGRHDGRDLRGIPLMISEVGAAASPSDDWTVRSEALQAAYVGQAGARAVAAGVEAVVWYTARDDLFGDCEPPHWDWLTFGLMRSDRYARAAARCPELEWLTDGYRLLSSAQPRPALPALAALVATLDGAEFERRLSAAETGGTALEAYLFRLPDRRMRVAAWADTGAPIGSRSAPAPRARLRLYGGILSPWSGRVLVTDHLGASRVVGASGDESVELPLNEAPLYIESVGR